MCPQVFMIESKTVSPCRQYVKSLTLIGWGASSLLPLVDASDEIVRLEWRHG